MLALTRKKGQAIIIDGDIEICIVDIQRDKVKIGIKAPKQKMIYREEVYRDIKESNIQAITGEQNKIKDLRELIKTNQSKK